MSLDQRLGLHLPTAGERGANATLAVHAPYADWVDACVFEPAGPRGELVERRVRLDKFAHGTHYGDVPGVEAGTRYGLRAGGLWDPSHGLRFNEHKLLIDPYATMLTGHLRPGQRIYSHAVDAAGEPVDGPASFGGTRVLDTTDSAAAIPHCVAMPVLPKAERGEYVRWSHTVLYEAHLKGLTALHPKVPAAQRGTWAGLANPAVLEHLVNLGVTAVELLPVFAKADEPHLTRQGLTNYWGYNHLSFFAPEPSLISAEARAKGPLAMVAEIRDAIAALHAVGLEVILDVVYNHTAEGGAGGPTYSLRGLGERTYYRVDEGGRNIDYSGTGNTLDFGKASVIRMALDSMRHWVNVYGVDGFRFDLAPILGRGSASRGREAYDADHPFLMACRNDPELSFVKLIAEPWDLGPAGWLTGEFPPPFAEWNDRFRDSVRAFWVADRGNARAAHPGPNRTDLSDLATRLAGSSDLFGISVSADHLPRAAWASVNYITSHDGFTLEDLLAFDEKHNEPNGEQNRDGTTNNLSWNHGVEGRTDRLDILASRHRTRMAILSTMILSVGTPMIVAGDELGRTQNGNNNPYSLDREEYWVDWALEADRRASAPARSNTAAGVRELLRLRRDHPVLSRFHRPDGRQVDLAGNPDVGWFSADGHPMTPERWHEPGVRTLQMALHGGPTNSKNLLVAINGRESATTFVLPDHQWASHWVKEWDSAAFADTAWTQRSDSPIVVKAGRPLTLTGCTVALFLATSGSGTQ